MSYKIPKYSRKSNKYYKVKRKKRIVLHFLFLAILLAFILPYFYNIFRENYFTSTIENTDSKICEEQYDNSYAQKLCELKVMNVADSDVPKYDRKKFGLPWADVDHNGCDTRNDILKRDLRERNAKGCIVLSGKLDDPYTGEKIDFKRGKYSAKVQIDHIVALKNAWISGAWKWSKNKLLFFANDPLNLIAVDGKANQEKGSQDFYEWKPSNLKVRCSYAKRQIIIKYKYGLSVTSQEKESLMKTISKC